MVSGIAELRERPAPSLGRSPARGREAARVTYAKVRWLLFFRFYPNPPRPVARVMPSFIIWFHSDSFFLPALLHVSLFLLLLFYVFFYVDVVRPLRPTYDRYHKYMEERDLPDENSQPPERDLPTPRVLRMPAGTPQQPASAQTERMGGERPCRPHGCTRRFCGEAPRNSACSALVHRQT